MTEKRSSRLNYIRRLFATGLSFSVFGLGAILLALTLLPASRIWPGSMQEKNARTRKVVHYSFRSFLWLMDILGCNTVFLEGRSQLRDSAGQLVIANHPSLIDVIILIACIPDCCCIVKDDLWRNPFLGGVVRWCGYIRNSDPETLMAQCRKTLANGCSIVVFPEGTRTVSGEPFKFQRGVANIAIRCKADIIPVTIEVNPPTLRKGEPWYHLPARRSLFTVEVLPSIAVNHFIDAQPECSLAARELNRYLQNYYQDRITYA